MEKDRHMEKSNKNGDLLTPHALFVEMDELDGAKWEEKARYYFKSKASKMTSNFSRLLQILSYVFKLKFNLFI